MFVGGYVFATATASLAQSRHSSLNAEQAEAEAVHFLVDLVRIDTQDLSGDESKVAHYLEGVLKSEGIESEILEPVPGRASIVARLKGNGKKRPLLIMGHEDVVPVDRSRWTVDPFAGSERDGVIYGRGASDDKAMVAANLEVLLQLKRMKVPLDRDVIFLSEASEEMSSPAGMATIVDRYWDKIDCEFALNEGGGSLVENGAVKYFGVATAEKLPAAADTGRCPESTMRSSISRPPSRKLERGILPRASMKPPAHFSNAWPQFRRPRRRRGIEMCWM